jgi:hypothetical protein
MAAAGRDRHDFPGAYFAHDSIKPINSLRHS